MNTFSFEHMSRCGVGGCFRISKVQGKARAEPVEANKSEDGEFRNFEGAGERWVESRNLGKG